MVTALSLWSAFRKALLSALDDTEGPLRARASRELAEFGGRVGRYDDLRKRLEMMVCDFVIRKTNLSADQATALVSTFQMD